MKLLLLSLLCAPLFASYSPGPLYADKNLSELQSPPDALLNLGLTVTAAQINSTVGSGGTGITSLNGLIGSSQTFAVPGVTGTAPNWSSSGSVHTLHIPMASTSSVTAGLLSKTDWDAFNAKLTATLASGKIFVGNGSNVATAVTPSGEATTDNTGAFTLTNSAVIGKVLTGYSSGAGTVASTDTVLQAINKLNGNEVLSKATADAALPSASFTSAAVTGKLLTGYSSGAGTVASTDTILQGFNKLNGNQVLSKATADAALPSASFTDAAVTGKVLTGYSSGAGTVSSADTILQAINKLNGNIAAVGGGGVTGPGSATNKAIAIYNGTGGSTIQNSNATITTNMLTVGTIGSVAPVVDSNDYFISVGADASGSTEPGFLAAVASASGDVPLFRTRISRGTMASPTIIKNTDFLGQWDMAGYVNGGLGFQQGVQMYGRATTDWAIGNYASEWRLSTHDGSSLLNRIYINGSGNVSVPNGSFTASHTVLFPALAVSSAATDGTLCWTTGTGNVTVDSTVACLASTRKVKQDIEPLESGLSTVMKLQPVSYQRKPEHNPQHNGREVGFIAEDVQKVDERLVAADEKGEVFGVRYMQYTAVLTKAIQEQQKQIQELKKEIKELRDGTED